MPIHHDGRTQDPGATESPALAGVERSFVSFSEAAEEASVSRIYNGNHTRVDQVAGENLGHNVAAYVLARGRGGHDR